MGQERGARHVADGIDPLHVGSEILVDLDEATPVRQGHAYLFETQVLGVRHPANG